MVKKKKKASEIPIPHGPGKQFSTPQDVEEVKQYKNSGDLQTVSVMYRFKLEIGCIGMRNVHPKGSMSFALKFGQNWQE